MDTIRQIITAPETDDVNALYEAYKTLPGNDAKSLHEFFLFMTAPSPERNYFLQSKARKTPVFADNVVNDKYEAVC